MTWLTTWQAADGTQYAEHPTEREAEAHANSLLRGNVAMRATWFEMADEVGS